MSEKDELYEMLLNQYKLVKDRTDMLTDRAHALLGFSGIVNTILISFILGIVKNEPKTFILKYFNSLLVQVIVVFGFVFYVFCMIFSLLAYRITPYMPIPQIASKEFIEEVFSGKTEVSKKHICFQLIDAINYHNKINRKKYTYLLLATMFLFLAMILTAILGIILFLIIS
jgi:hypothetical protein